MSSKQNFIKATQRDGVTQQTLYIDAGSAGEVAEVIKEKGSKRVLILSNKATLDYRPVEAMIKKYNDTGLRTFIYQRRNIVADSRDIEGALDMYKEYNCDTIVVVGNRHDIYVAKMTAVCATNPGKPASFAGIGNIKYDIKLLVCIVVDSTPTSATPECTFFDHYSNTWINCISQIMLPHIVVIDSEMMMRNNTETVAFSSLNALCFAIEAYLSPFAANNPEYKANAAVAIYKIIGRLDNLVADKLDPYLQTKVAVGGFYAGLSTVKLGFGYTYFIMHEMQIKYGCEYGVGMGRILVKVLREMLEFSADDMAEISRSQHFCTSSLDTISAAQTFIETVGDIYNKNTPDEVLPNMTPDDRQKIAENVRRVMTDMGYQPRIATDRLTGVLYNL